MKRIIAIVTILVFLVIYALLSQVTNLSAIEYDGYAAQNNDLVQNLISENVTVKEARIKSVKFSAYDNIYKQYNNIYIGKEEKVKINETLPLYINNNLTIINLSDINSLIDENFIKTEGYLNSMLSEGILYNRGDNERADYNNYYFLLLSSGMHVNSKLISLKTTLREINIPLNSIINFEKDKIKYYSLEDDTFVYYKADDVDDNTIVTIENKDYKYIDFLKKLNIYEDDIPNVYDPNEKEEPNKDNGGTDLPGNNEIVYQKPSVECDQLIGNVYSASTTLRIFDPSMRIKKAVTFEIKKDGNLFLRKAFINSGKIEINGLEPDTTYEVKGYFTYRNEDDVLIENTFYNGKITTSPLSKLPAYNLSFSNGTIYSKKIEILNLSTTNNLDPELIKGTRKVAVSIDGEEYNLSGKQLSLLLKGEKINFETPETLKSNQKIDYEFIIYDLFGNKLKVNNNKGTTKTSKVPPTASVKVLKNAVSNVELEVKLNNEDEVELSNYRYVITNPSGVIVKDGDINNEVLKFDDLDLEQLYLIYIYGDYNINDGNGSVKNQILAESKFVTTSISSLGYIRMKMETDTVTQDSAKLKMQINTDTTDARLISLLEKMNINLTNENTNKYYGLTNEQIEKLKNHEEISLDIEDLTSATEYNITLTSIVKQGTKSYALKTLSNLTSFKTLKKEAQILIKNSFTTENLIDFDVLVEDIDHAIESNRVILEMRDSKNQILDAKYLKINDDYVRFTFDKLDKGQKYTFNYIVEEYNVGYKNNTFRENVLLLKQTVITEEGISGSIGLTGLLKEQQGKNLFDINNLQKWKGNGASSGSKSYSFANNVIFLTGTNGWYNYSYYLPEYKSKTLTISFYAKYEINDNNNKAPIYISNSDSSGATYRLQNLSENYQKYTYTFVLNSKGYIGFLINETSGKGLSTMISIKDLQIEEGNQATTYDKFKETTTYNASTLVNLNDSREEIPDDQYYVKVYKGNDLKNTYKYTMENNRISHEHDYVLDQNSNYTLDLIVKIREREYIIASTNFTTEAEIRSIKTITDFFNMHNNGKYIVLNDLNFENNGGTYGTFSGELDFQGHSIYLNKQNRPSYLISTINTTATIKNLVMKIKMDNPVEITEFHGLAYYNNGNIENLMINLTSATPVPNTRVGFIARENRGTVNNFVIKSDAKLYGIREVTYGVIYNYGTMKNGYIYGEGIDVTHSNPTTGNKRVGAFSTYTGESSIIENVYSLITIDSSLETTYDKQVGNLVGESGRGIVRNAYSVGTGINRDLTRDPNIGAVSSINFNNLFYASDDIYNSSYSIKVAKLAIRDDRFQNNVINKDKKFNVEENVEKGYYPQIIFPDCMPNQIPVLLPEVKDADLVDITSLEVLETSGDTAKVVFNVNNPDGEKITKIDVKNVNTRIISQTYSKGKSQVIAEITNPVEYVSKYYVKKIVSVGVFNITTTRTYDDNERVLLFDLYRRVYTIDDFRLIKESPKENYILENDLDFSGISNYLLGTFSGKLDGNNHTISNIKISSGNGLVSTLNGTIKNLFVENYIQNSSTAYAGLIYSAASGSVIDNVHMNNVNIVATQRVGGIVGSGSGTIIKNSSVTNFKHTTTSDAVEDLYVGSLAGYLDNSYIENSYAQDLNIDVTKARTTYGVGGIVGRIAGGVIKNTYAIGSIDTNSSHTGGIVGYTSGRISNVYSNVNIVSSLDFIGGISGRSENSYISNTLSLGSIYSSYLTSYMHRTAGDMLLNKINYVWDKQLINGFISEELYGEYFVTKDELTNATIYSNTIGLGEDFDYKEVSQGYLPKLKNTDGTILAKQKNNTLKIDTTLNVNEINIFKRTDDVTVSIVIDNPGNLKIKNIEFDYLTVTNINKNGNLDGETIFEVEAKPNRYYDSYKLTKIIYEEKGTEKTINKSNRIEMQFYKNISGFEQWQSIPKDTAENYRLTADIDFTDRVNINRNVSLGRLEGMDNGHILKNLTLEVDGSNQSLIDEITVSLKNVSFENIKIVNKTTKALNYNNLIRLSYADIRNVNFKDITLTARPMSYVGIIGNQRGYNIDNITLNNINVVGNSFSSGFISRSYNLTTNIRNVQADKVNVEGYDYVGGIIGHREYTPTTYIFDINGTNMNVSGHTYVGGLFGLGGGTNINISNSEIKGTGNYVGGIGGNSYTYNITDNKATNIKVIGEGTYTGGLYGYSYILSRAYVIDSTITSPKTTAIYTGGVIGISGYTISQIGVINTSIISSGKYAGGIRGHQNAGVSYSYVYNSIITAYDGAGGISGYVDGGNVQDSYVNAKITATNSGAGGIYGYVQNTNTTNSIQVSKIIRGNVFDSTITAYTNAGGLIGYATSDLYKDVENNIYHYYSNMVVASINTTNPYGTATAAVGNNVNYASSILNLKVYNKTLINNVPLDDILTSGISPSSLVTSNNLKTQSTYTSIGFSSAAWNFTKLTSNYFPFVRNGSSVDIPNQIEISLPANTLSKVVLSRIHELPSLSIYASDVDKLNLEFNRIDSNVDLTFKSNNISSKISGINKRTYTLSYDYQHPIEITLTDGINTKTEIITADEVRRNISVYGDNYYYIKNKQLNSNIKALNNKFVNLFNNYGLDEKGNIYNLETKGLIRKIDTIKVIETKPLYEFIYDNYKIKTFNHYSVVIKDEEIINELILLVKNNKLSIMDGNAKIDYSNIIIDNYKDKEIQTILSNEKMLYNLKEKIKVSDDFKNKDIKAISNNLNSNNNIVIIEYEDNSFVGFDYLTGKIVFEDKEKSEVSLLSYLRSNFSLFRGIKPEEKFNEAYEDGLKLEQKLTEKPLSIFINNITDNTTKNKYLTKYDNIQNKFLVYDEKEVLTKNDENIKAENNKIDSDTKMIDFYFGTVKSGRNLENNNLNIFIIIAVGIVISLILWLINIRFIQPKKKEI